MFWKIGGQIVKRRGGARRLDLSRVNTAVRRAAWGLNQREIKPVKLTNKPLPMPGE
jgi:hypothetical protein